MSYTVHAGDSLSAIAARNHVTLAALENANPQIKNPNAISVGQSINIPGQSDTFQASLPVPSQNLARGSSGAAVKQLQTDLVHLGLLSQADMNTGPGIYGAHTQAAVARLQAKYGITGNGGANYGPQTRAALTRALATPRPPAPPTPKPPTPSSYTAPSQNLAVGNNSAAVKQLQSDLVHLGYLSQANMNTGPGIYGSHTAAALSAFQNAWGIYGNGGQNYGPETRAALTKALGGIKPPAPPAPHGSGAAAVAREFLGMSEYQLQPSGRLDMDQWVPKTEDCANFVSGCLEKAGLISHGQRSDGVVNLFGNLRGAGWRDIPNSQMKPGDVVAFDGPGGNYQHVEIFDHWQGSTPVFIGSNNIMADGTQKISYDVGGTWAYRFHAISPP